MLINKTLFKESARVCFSAEDFQLYTNCVGVGDHFHSLNKGHDYFNMPYNIHLQLVNQVFLDYAPAFGIEQESLVNVLAAIWLHDVLEDTHLNYNQLIDEIVDGKSTKLSGILREELYWDYRDKCQYTVRVSRERATRVVELVYMVTDELGRNRTERSSKTYPKIAEDRDAVFLKLCDRVANIRFSKSLSILGLKINMLEAYRKQNSTMRDYFGPAVYPEFTLMWKEISALLN